MVKPLSICTDCFLSALVVQLYTGVSVPLYSLVPTRTAFLLFACCNCTEWLILFPVAYSVPNRIGDIAGTSTVVPGHVYLSYPFVVRPCADIYNYNFTSTERPVLLLFVCTGP